jgi:septum site-determining protein MinC
MKSNTQKIIINIADNKHLNWELNLKNELKKIESNNLEIDCKNLDLSCSDILELIKIANQYNCEILSFCSSSAKTIISSQSLGYKSQFIIQNNSNKTSKINDKNLNFSKTHFHQGTVRSGEYLEIPGDLLILGDVNPGAIVSAEENIIIWGRLLGIAHAGRKGNSQATISALQLRPVQIRIANKVARGPKEKPQLGLAEQAKIDSSGKIIISPLESI